MGGLDEIDALRGAVHGDPKRVAQAACLLAATARADADPATLSRVLSVLGRARRALGAMDLAEADLVAALEAARSAGDPELAADAHLGMAGVYAFTGRSAEAMAQLDQVHQLGSPKIRAYAALQRAALEQRIGRLHDALAGYERALPTLRELDARVDIALVLMNRGVIRTQLADCDAAIADLTEARLLFAADDNAYAVAQTWHGLGWAYAGRGDLAAALRHLDGAAERFHKLGHTAPEVEVDRTEVLLAAGLSGMAAQVARGVAERLAAAGNNWHVAHAWLLCARACLLEGDQAAAAGYAKRAREIFAEHGAVAWEQAAQLELIRARGRSADVAELCDLAAVLDAAGNARVATSALALACAAAAAAGDLDLATGLSAECEQRAARLGVFEVRMQARYATAACAEARGDDTSARRHVRTGLADLRRPPRLGRGARRAYRSGRPRRTLGCPRPSPRAAKGLSVGGPGLHGAGPRRRIHPTGSAATGRRCPRRAVARAAFGGDAHARGRGRRPGHHRPATPPAPPGTSDPRSPAAARRPATPFPAHSRRRAPWPCMRPWTVAA